MSHKKFNYLYALDDILSHYVAQHTIEGEDWHPIYKKYRDLFRKVIKSDVETERSLIKVFKRFADRADEFVNWTEVGMRMAAEDVVLPLDTNIFLDFEDMLTISLVGGLSSAIEAGGEFVERETGIVVGWTQYSTPAMDYMRKNNLALVKNLSKTTHKRIKSSLFTSLDLGEDRNTMIDRLQKVITDRRRASVIAHTETIRAYTQGRIEVANELKDLGFETVKVWMDNQPGACPICIGLHGERVKEGKMFSGGFDGPPAHPSCRCGMTIDVTGQ